MQDRKRIALWVVRIALTGVCLWVLTRLGGGTAIYRNLLGIGIFLAGLKIVMTFSRMYLMGLRWQILNPSANEEISAWQYFRLTFYSTAFNLIMPGALGGDIIRSAMVAGKVTRDRTKNALSVFADRFVGLASIMLLGALATLLSGPIPNRGRYLALFGVLIGCSVLGLALIRPLFRLFHAALDRPSAGKIRRWILHMCVSIQHLLDHYARNPWRVAAAFALSVPVHGMIFVLFHLAALRAGIHLSFFAISMVTALVWLISAIPISLAGFGVREISTVYLLMTLGTPRDAAATYAVYLVSITLIGSATAVVFVLLDMLAGMIRDAARRRRPSPVGPTSSSPTRR